MIYRNQYLILKRRVELPEFSVTPLWDGWLLHAHRALRVCICPENRTLLLGLAWQTMPGRGAPEEELRALKPGADGEVSSEDILRTEETWCGRYVLLSGQRVFPDATGKRGIYYCADGVAGNLALLAEVLGLPPVSYRPARQQLNWMPGPLTPCEPIRRCLPSQIYDMASGTALFRPLLVNDAPALDGEEALLGEIVRCFDESLRNLYRTAGEKKLLSALTGGFDSRALFALLKHAGVPFTAFTLQHEHISAPDTIFPPRVCERVGVPYTYIPQDDAHYDVAREAEYISLTSGLIWDADREFYAHGQYQQLLRENGPSLLLRSSIWGALAERYGAAFDSDGPNEVFYEWFGIADGSLECRSVELYLDWMRVHPQPGLCPADAFFWDQREGCWMEPIESGFDLLDGAESLQPANCRYLLTLLSRFPREMRLTKAYEARIAAYACPEIADIPYTLHSGTQSKAAFYLGKVKKAFARLRRMGLKKTVKTYGSILRHRREVKKFNKNG